MPAADSIARSTGYPLTEWEVLQQTITRLEAQKAELLTALRIILQSHDALCPGEDCHISGIDLARAAIAKAEGRS